MRMRLTGSLAKTLSLAVLMRSLSTMKSVEPGMVRRRRRAGMPRRRFEHRRRLAVVLLQRGAEDAGQIADVLGDQEVVLHEALDVLEPGMGGVAQPLRHIALDVEGQPFLGAAGEEVQVAAHRPQEILRLAEEPQLALRENAEGDQFVVRGDAEEILGDPEQRVEIAQAALALLDVGLDQIARGALAAVALVAFGELGGDEFGPGALDHLGIEAGGRAFRSASSRRRGSAPPAPRCGWSCRSGRGECIRRPSGWRDRP